MSSTGFEIRKIVMSTDEVGGWYTRGHVPTRQFRAALIGWEEASDDDASCRRVRHVWLRRVPRPGSYFCDAELMLAKPGARGAFKATLMMVVKEKLRTA